MVRFGLMVPALAAMSLAISIVVADPDASSSAPLKTTPFDIPVWSRWPPITITCDFNFGSVPSTLAITLCEILFLSFGL